MGIPSFWLLFQQNISIYAQKSTAIVLESQKKKNIHLGKKLKSKQIQKTSTMTSAKQTCSHSTSCSSSSMSTAFTIIISLVLCICSMLYAVHCKTKHHTKTARMEKKLIELQELLENLKEKVDQYSLEVLL
jgi:predicted permease